ncbi:MAG: hypothetical protein CXZ00_03135 [Acidobacteria bacterium]|nr:MAG: hypothetical protein CXZ00_03135 [Acidobacteriota bacterium]
MSIARSQLSPEQLAHKWNRRFPIGTRVRYWTGTRDKPGKVSVTKSEAQVLGGHTAVLWVEGESGCISLSHVEPIAGGAA